MAFLYLTFFILGSAIGSFLNVVADRVPAGKSILGRSHCDYCRRKLSAFDLVPIFSFFVIGGRCRRCKKRLSWQYPIAETVCGFLFLLSFWQFTQVGSLNFLNLIYILFICSIMVLVAIVDFKSLLIPTSFVFAASLIALFYDYFFKSSSDFITSIIGAFVFALFFALIVLVTRGRGMGEGDIILAFLIGMVLGMRDGMLAIFLAFLFGAVVAIFLIIFGKKRFGQAIPFAPFLVLGFFTSLFFAGPIINYYLLLY